MAQAARSSLSLRDLILPITPETFIERHVVGGTHYLSESNPAILDALRAIDSLRSLERLVRRFEHVSLFGPNGFRSSVPGAAAMDFYNRGDTLYISDAEKRVPELLNPFRTIAQDLGVQPRDLSIELFAGRAKAISTLHYDHDTNFQILLKGTKRWRLQPNLHIHNPLLPNHRLRAAPREEALADRRPFPITVNDLEDPIEIVTMPGTCLFFPLGYWHEVESSADSFAINLVLKPPRWVDVIGAAARRTLLARPELRAPVFGAFSPSDSPLKRRALDYFSTGLAAYAKALESLSPDDVACSNDGTAMRWSDKCQDRRLEQTPEGWRLICAAVPPGVTEIDPALGPAIQQLIGFRGVFTLDELKSIVPDAPTKKLFAVMRYLKSLSYFEEA